MALGPGPWNSQENPQEMSGTLMATGQPESPEIYAGGLYQKEIEKFL